MACSAETHVTHATGNRHAGVQMPNATGKTQLHRQSWVNLTDAAAPAVLGINGAANVETAWVYLEHGHEFRVGQRSR